MKRLGRTTTGADNEAPPVGPIVLDLHGTTIPHVYQQYTVGFVATSENSFISFAFREDPAYLGLDDISVTTGGGPNLLVNGGFESGILGESAPIGWTYLNEFEATHFGVVAATSSGPHPTINPRSGTYFYFDGSVQAYDVITQQIVTSIGHTYLISFWLVDNSVETSFRRQSDNGLSGTGGNGINLIVYAGDSEPTWGLGLDACIGSMFEPGNPGNATDSGAITMPRYPTTWNLAVSEPTSAATTLDAGLVFERTVMEAASAADTASASLLGTVYAASIAEAAAAASTQDATVSAITRTAVVAGVEPVFSAGVSVRAYRLKSGTTLGA